MRRSVLGSLAAIGALLWMAPLASADDLGFSELDRRLTRLAPNRGDGVRQVAYMSDVAGHEEVLPSEGGPMPGSAYEPGDGCYDGYCYASDCGCQQYAAPSYPQKGMFYTEAQLMFLRAHVLEESLGKLSEKYEFTPRFIAGYETASGVGARARYWTYGRTTPNLDDPDDALRLEFDVIDAEGTARFRGERADLLVAGGFRWVNADIEVEDDAVNADMPGITVACDGRARICGGCRSQWSGVAGGRWSILGADWEGDQDALIEPTFDDNIVVTELYGGFEYLCRHGHYDLYARIVFETQNWRSDALGESADTDSLGFVGPGVHVGATF
jgi:hypothetical protein